MATLSIDIRAIGYIQFCITFICFSYVVTQLKYPVDPLEEASFGQNSCPKLNISKFLAEKRKLNPWMPSVFDLFKESVSVRLAIWFALFMGAYTNVVLAFAMGTTKLARQGGCHLHRLIRSLSVLNEIWHGISILFVVNSLAIGLDNYSPLFKLIGQTAVISFGLKVIFSVWHSLHTSISWARLLLFFVSASTYNFYVAPISTKFTVEIFDTSLQEAIEFVLLSCYLYSQLLNLLESESMVMIIRLPEDDEERSVAAAA